MCRVNLESAGRLGIMKLGPSASAYEEDTDDDAAAAPPAEADDDDEDEVDEEEGADGWF